MISLKSIPVSDPVLFWGGFFSLSQTHILDSLTINKNKNVLSASLNK